jgi:hypothetical protein
MLRGGDYVERSDVCFHCHDRGAYRGRNIHADVAGADSCDFCHVVKNRTALSPEGTVGDLVAEPSLLCLLCHSPPPHPASSDHTGRPHKHSFVTLDEEITPLTMGKVTCHTCHDSHSPSLEENYLRKTGAATLVCDNCHPF